MPIGRLTHEPHIYPEYEITGSEGQLYLLIKQFQLWAVPPLVEQDLENQSTINGWNSFKSRGCILSTSPFAKYYVSSLPIRFYGNSAKDCEIKLADIRRQVAVSLSFNCNDSATSISNTFTKRMSY